MFAPVIDDYISRSAPSMLLKFLFVIDMYIRTTAPSMWLIRMQTATIVANRSFLKGLHTHLRELQAVGLSDLRLCLESVYSGWPARVRGAGV